jgi:hypothetical protein
MGLRLSTEKQEHFKEYLKKYRAKTPDNEVRNFLSRELEVLWRDKIKLEVLTYYSDYVELKCSVKGCEISDIDMLTIDHINDNGAEERRNNTSRRGARMYKYLKDQGYPDGYQTLCMNHNLKKEVQRGRKIITDRRKMLTDRGLLEK